MRFLVASVLYLLSMTGGIATLLVAGHVTALNVKPLLQLPAASPVASMLYMGPPAKSDRAETPAAPVQRPVNRRIAALSAPATPVQQLATGLDDAETAYQPQLAREVEVSAYVPDEPQLVLVALPAEDLQILASDSSISAATETTIKQPRQLKSISIADRASKPLLVVAMPPDKLKKIAAAHKGNKTKHAATRRSSHAKLAHAPVQQPIAMASRSSARQQFARIAGAETPGSLMYRALIGRQS